MKKKDPGPLITAKMKLFVTINYTWKSETTRSSTWDVNRGPGPASDAPGPAPEMSVRVLVLLLNMVFWENFCEVPHFTELAFKDNLKIAFVTW